MSVAFNTLESLVDRGDKAGGVPGDERLGRIEWDLPVTRSFVTVSMDSG